MKSVQETKLAISAERESVLRRAADLLLTARRTNVAIPSLPEWIAPADEAEAALVQDVMAAAFSPVGGWKIGAAGPEGVPAFSAMPAAWMGANGAEFRGANHRLRGVEAEVAFRIGTALPQRPEAYSRDEVVAAIASCHPAIEILESAFVDPFAVPAAHKAADLAVHGGFVAGPAVPQWREIDWAAETVVLTADGSVRVEGAGSSPSGPDLIRLLMYLANQGAERTGGLHAGDWITTGSWTGATWVAPCSAVVARFGRAGAASLQFGADVR